MEDEFITLSALKDRGWTDSIIKKMNVLPDKIAKNPHYLKASPMKLYMVSKIEEFEKSEQFCNLIVKSQSRKEGAKKAVETKIAKLYKYVETVSIEIEFVPEPQVTYEAIEAYNIWQENRPSIINGNKSYQEATINSDDGFLGRIRGNYIRHNLTNYDDILAEIKGHTGISEVYPDLKNKVMTRINIKWKNHATSEENTNLSN
jgi:hypothetical protein